MIAICRLRSQGSTKRHVLRPKGSTKMRSTSEGNRLARRLTYLPCPQQIYIVFENTTLFGNSSTIVTIWSQDGTLLQKRNLLCGGTAHQLASLSIWPNAEDVETPRGLPGDDMVGGVQCPNP